MERYIMFLNWKDQYCENDQSNLKIKCHPYQTTNDIFHRSRIKNSRFIWKHKRSQLAKQILKKKNGAGVINLRDFRLQTKLQSSRQYGTSTQAEIQTNGTRWEVQS